jgi:HSP20 family protein
MIIVKRSVHRNPTSVQREMERVFRSWVPQATSMPVSGARNWRPALEVIESDSVLTVTAELAGIDQELLDVTVDGDVLAITGHRPGPKDHPNCSYREAGIAYGDFSAEIFIPDQLVLDEATASYKDGMLTIRIPKATPVHTTPRHIALSNPEK